MRRPFGQLNVKTLDMAAIPDPTLKPTKVKVAFTAVPTSFNAKKGEIGAATAAVEYTADVLSADGDLTVDYIWAPVEEATLADFSMTFLNGTTEISTNGDFKNIPIRRNYRTNVSGNLLTKQGTFNVTIDPEFYKPDINDYPELRAALANGGSVTLLSMLPFVLVSFRHGVKWGLFTGLVNGCLQMLLGFWAPPTPTFIYFLGEILLDYLVAFMALGTAEFFARPFKNRMVGVAVGTAIAGFLRFMCSFLSGVLVWGNLNEGLSAWTYSLVYNASYMLPETLLTVVGAVLLIKAAPQIFDRQYTKA